MDAADRSAWQHADRLFAELIELDAQARERRLETLSAPEAVRRHLLRMLASTHKQSWLDHENPGLSATARPENGPEPVSMRGRRLGHWEIGGELGRGGMAVVYRARRVDGAVDQEVALKVLTIASLSRHGAERFQGETRILARLRHPHIVGLLDTGITEDGTPWLAMPLVDGVHISRWCDEHALDTRATVQLFLQVAGAVASAHRSLVIHRDIKPSNVLVDAEGQVHLLDFGIARLLNETEHATVTQWRALTPGYAAPEQHTGESVTTAVDVHGLGALLYRLLTGQPPRGGESGDITLPSQAAARQAPTSTRHRLALLKDLDPVLMKALAADPAARYVSVDAFSTDLQRWLHGKPVLATPPSRSYRLRKFVSRYRLGVAASAAILLTLAVGIGGTLWQARIANTQAAQATAVKDFVLGLFAAANPNIAQGTDPTASLLLREGAERVRKDFSTRPLVLGEMLGMIGRVQLERGLFDDARSSLDDAIAAFERNSRENDKWAIAIGDRGMLAFEQGEPEEALRLLREAQAMAIAAGVEANEPERVYLDIREAEMQVEIQEYAKAEQSARAVLQKIENTDAINSLNYPDVLGVLSASLQYQGNQEAALDVLQDAEAAQVRIAPNHPKLAVLLNDLANLLHRMGRHAEAETVMQRAIEQHQAIYGPLHPQTLRVMGNRASMSRVWHGAQASAREYEHLLPLLEQALNSAPHPLRVNMLAQLAVARDETGEAEAALAAAREAWRMQKNLSDEEQERSNWVPAVYGLFLFQQGDPEGAKLLAGYEPANCMALDQRTPFTRHVCIAKALLAHERGKCLTLPATAPPASEVSAYERNWWLAWWLLRQDCEEPDAALADAAIASLRHNQSLPTWLASHRRFNER